MASTISNNKRLGILSQQEVDHYYGLPQFCEEERKWAFELNQDERKIFYRSISTAAKVDTILQLVYFKIKRQFFKFDLADVQADVHYIVQQYFDQTCLKKTVIDRRVKYKNQRWILTLLGYQPFQLVVHLPLLLSKANEIATLSNDPLFIFNALYEFIQLKKITLPGYTTLQDIISQALYTEQQRISQILDKTLSLLEKQQLLSLLEQPQTGFYAITFLKKAPKNFKPSAIYQEIEHFEKYQPLYQLAKRTLPMLVLSKNSIAYFALLVDHYTVQGLSRTQTSQTCLWLLCFLSQRYQYLLDNLATLFIYTARQYEATVAEKSQEQLLLETLGETEQKVHIAKLLKFYIDKTIDRSQPFSCIVAKAHTIMAPEFIEKIAAQYENKKFHEKFIWQNVDGLAPTYKPLLRALLKILPLESEQHTPLQQSIAFIKAALATPTSLTKMAYDAFPKHVLTPQVKKFIVEEAENKIYPNRYEYYCYLQVAKYLDAKSLFINDSLHYKSLQSELIPNWQHDKDSIIAKLGKPRLSQSIEQFIEEKAKPLDKKIIEVNEAITEGRNNAVKIKADKNGALNWTLPYTKKTIELNNPFYERITPVSINQVLHFVHKNTGFVKQFTHIKPHKAKSKRDVLSIFACLIANATNLGVGKMAEMCELNLSTLQTADKNFLRLSTLHEANEVISNAIAALPIFRYWNFVADLLHASLDGQKFATERDTLLARYSPKYFGLGKGVVAYTLLANHVPVNVKIIGANEHESRYLFDLVYNNTTLIQPDIFSSDTEGTNQLNFILLYIIEKLFAPRYRSLPAKTDSIVSYSDAKKFKDYLIKPKRKLNYSVLQKEESNIQHILASLLLGETSQSNIVGKLSSQHFENRTKLALWEMNAVLMSDYLLDYISDVVLRQSVQGSLNRGEAYHQLRRHISLIHGKHFRGTSEIDIAVWNECARLLANATIYLMKVAPLI